MRLAEVEHHSVRLAEVELPVCGWQSGAPQCAAGRVEHHSVRLAEVEHHSVRLAEVEHHSVRLAEVEHPIVWLAGASVDFHIATS